MVQNAPSTVLSMDESAILAESLDMVTQNLTEAKTEYPFRLHLLKRTVRFNILRTLFIEMQK